MDPERGSEANVVEWLEGLEHLPAHAPVLTALVRGMAQSRPKSLPAQSLLLLDPAIAAWALRRYAAEWFAPPLYVPEPEKLLGVLGPLRFRTGLVSWALSEGNRLSRPADDAAVKRWRKALRRALAAEGLARETGDIRPMDAYFTGLLWDVGGLAGDVLADGDGADRSGLGRLLAQAWRLPETVTGALGLAGLPLEGLYDAYPSAPLAELVTLADAVAARPGGGVIALAPPGALSRLGIQLEPIEALCAELPGRVDQRLAPLGIDPDAAPLEPAELQRVVARLLDDAGRLESENRRAAQTQRAHESAVRLLESAAACKGLEALASTIAEAVQRGLGVAPGLCCVPEPGGNKLGVASWRSTGQAPAVTVVDPQDAASEGAPSPGLALQALGFLGVGLEETGWQVGAAQSAQWEGLAALPLSAEGRCWGQLFLDTGMDAALADSGQFAEWAAFAKHCGTAIARYSESISSARRQGILLDRLRQLPVAQETLPEAGPGPGAAGPFAALAVRSLRPALNEIHEVAQGLTEQTGQDPAGAADLLQKHARYAQDLLQAALDATHPPERGAQPCDLNMVIRALLSGDEKSPPVKWRVALSNEVPPLAAEPGTLRRLLRYALDSVLPADEVWVQSQPRLEGAEVLVSFVSAAPPLGGRDRPLWQAAAKALAQVLGGSCAFGQAPEGGIEATLSLPAQPVPKAPRPSEEATKEEAPSPTPTAPADLDQPSFEESAPATLLVVDDDGSVRSVLRSAFQERGYRVFAVETVEEAMRRLASSRVDLLMVDTECGGPGGAAPLLAKLKVTEGAPPAVAMLPSESPELHDDARRSGFQACVAKPFQLRQLVALAEASLAGTAAS